MHQLYTQTQGIIPSSRIVRLRISPQMYDWSYLGLVDIKRSIERFITKFVEPKKDQLVVADLGCGNAPYKPLFHGVKHYIGVDAYPGPAVDIVAPIWATTLENNSVDIVFITEVLEHVRYPLDAIKEIKRILKPGGRLFLTIPFMYPVHSDDDEWRYTAHGLKDIFGSNGFDAAIEPSNGPWVTMGQLSAIVLQSFPLGRYIFIPLFIVINILAPVLDLLNSLIIKVFKFMPEKTYRQIKFSAENSMPLQYVVIATKK